MGPQHAVPYVEDPDLEYQLHRQLEAHPKTALVGVGGAGKTSLITHYAEHHAGLYPEGVFIIDATDGQAARRDLATRLQRLLNGPRMANLPREVIEVLRVRSGLAHLAEGQAAEWTAVLAAYFIERLDRGAGQYLLVFDNVASAGAMTGMFAGLVPDLSDREALVERLAESEPFLQHGDPSREWAALFVADYVERSRYVADHSSIAALRGKVLVVTNRDDGDPQAAAWVMPTPAHAYGARIVAAHAQDESLAGSAEVLELVTDLGGLPLALAQAGATIRSGRYRSVADYRADLVNAIGIDDAPPGPTRVNVMRAAPAHESVRRTTELAIRAVRRSLGDAEQADAAVALIENCAVLHPGRIPGRLLRAMDTCETDAVVNALVGSLLLQPTGAAGLAPSSDVRDTNYRMHRVHQAAICGRMSRERTGEATVEAARAVSLVLPDPASLAGKGPYEHQSFHDLYDQAEESIRRIAEMAGPEERDPEDGLPTAGFVEQLLDCPPEDDYTIADLLRESRIQRWLLAGRWQAVLTGVNRPGLTYEDMYCLETEEDHRRLRRICASLWRAGTSADAMTAAACMFYAAHYWWTEYIPENHICGPVLEALESSVVGRPDRVGATEASDRPKQLVQCLRRFYDRYPGSYYYSERTSRSQEDWHVVEAALRGIRQALDLESVGARGQGSDQIADRHLDAQCFARGITDLYLAAAIRYAQGRHDPDDAEVLGLYEDAERILAQAGDDMHREWCAFERADAYVDAARRYQAQAPGIFGRGSGAKARHCIDLGRTWCGECRRRASTGPHVDDEIVARSYRMDGDLLWMQGERAEALACYCAASYMALAFLEQDRDDYARHVYEETRRHIIERIGDIGLDEDGLDRAVRMCRLVYAFWNTSGHTADAGIEDVFLPLTDPNRVSDRTKLAFHRAILAEKLTRDLAPPTPRLSDLGDGDDITPYLAYARSILLAMPAHLKRIQADEGFAGFSMPADFAGAGGFVELTATRLTEPDGSAANE